MIQRMTVGNQLYSSLSLLAKQSMLMLTEIPEMVTGFERFFLLEYSGSYTCNMHGVYTLYYAHAKLKALKGKRLRGNTGIVHLSIERWNLLKGNI